MASSAELQEHAAPKSGGSPAAQISTWVGIIGSVVTVVLTLWNVYTKSEIDKREAELQQLEIKLKERTTGVEESKERVDRYKWVLSLFPTLNSKDAKERNFTLNLARLALTNEEAEQLFASLQASTDSVLRSIGETGIKSIENEPINLLVSQLNAGKSSARIAAYNKLTTEYDSSHQAVVIALRTFDDSNIGNLSESAIINGLYFLSRTEVAAWERPNLKIAKDVLAKVRAKKSGKQTQAAIDALDAKLKKVESALQ